MPETERMGLFFNEYEITGAPPDPLGNTTLSICVQAFVDRRFRDGELGSALIGRNHAQVLAKRDHERYECVLGEFPIRVVHSMSSSPPVIDDRVFYAEFPAHSARLAAFMERCNYGREFALFADNVDTERVREDYPKWLLDSESNIAYYVVFKMGGLIDEANRHVLFAGNGPMQLEHFLTTVLSPRALAWQRAE
jgi:hypothetical protein